MLAPQVYAQIKTLTCEATCTLHAEVKMLIRESTSTLHRPPCGVKRQINHICCHCTRLHTHTPCRFSSAVQARVHRAQGLALAPVSSRTPSSVFNMVM